MSTMLLTDEYLWELVESHWNTLFHLPVTRDGQASNVRPSNRLVASIDLWGTFHGRVSFLTTDQFARHATAILLAAPTTSLQPADMNDAMGELCNVLAGGIKSLLPGPTSLTTPSVVHCSPWTVPGPPEPLVAHLCFTCEGQPLEVRVLEKIDAACGNISR